MTVFEVLTLCGGLAMFLYGMSVMSSGLEKMAGGRLEGVLRKMTSNRVKALLLGAGITAAIQSSSAMTVMLVGLVNSGIMQLGQTVGVIMGSNVGTTVTAWLLSLAGISSKSTFIQLLKPSSFAPIVALIGMILILVGKGGRKRDIGNVMVGFALLMFGMDMMSGAVAPLAKSEAFMGVLTMFRNPLLGVLAGTAVTMVIQSSSASVGILQAFSMTGGLTYGMAIPIIMGQNIGTCVTSLISSIGANKNAKRVAVVHIFFNLIGTAVCLSVFYALNAIMKFAFVGTTIAPFSIAIVHSVFNITTTAILLPFSKQLEKLARLTVRDKEKVEQYVFLDERLLLSPSFAIAECRNMTVTMADLAKTAISESVAMTDRYDTKRAAVVTETEDVIDTYEDKLGTFLVKLSSKELTERDSIEASRLLHVIGDLERIGDHAVNLLGVAEEIHDKKIVFSPEATEEIGVFKNAVNEIITIAFDAFRQNNPELAGRVEPLEQVIDGLKSELKSRHIRRLQQGKCTIELGFVLSDMIANFERISDHCSNIAVTVIQMSNGEIDSHSYLNEVRTAGGEKYVGDFEGYREKYALPQR